MRLTDSLNYLRAHGARRFAQRVRERLLVRAIRNLGRLFPRNRNDPYHRNFVEFVQRVNQLERRRVLEVGSRAVSGNIHRNVFLDLQEYVGFDYHAGENVDVTGDAHELSSCVPHGHFDAAFSISVFEHLAMPWKVVLELNKVLRPGGLVFVATHPTWPAHERPWDFWRFSSEAFRVLFNARTGFSILACDEGLPCTIVPHANADSAIAFEPANLGVSLIAQKLSDPDPDLQWDLRTEAILSTAYPRPGSGSR